MGVRDFIEKLLESDRLYVFYQLSKPVLGFLFLAGVLYLDRSLNESGCRFMLEQSEFVLRNITNSSGGVVQ